MLTDGERDALVHSLGELAEYQHVQSFVMVVHYHADDPNLCEGKVAFVGTADSVETMIMLTSAMRKVAESVENGESFPGQFPREFPWDEFPRD